ncbi:hypothetical protein H0O00_03080 [Candidatus Micrarchaeota archaeon]|nr:hypothetical protein [Candidatus Micrarchaeota archaeon]
MKSGRTKHTGMQKEYHELVQRWNTGLAPLARSWHSAKDLFYPGRVARTIDEALKHPDINIATPIFVLSAFMTLALSLISTVESVHLAEYTMGIIADMGATPPMLDFSNLGAMVVYQYVMYVPVALLFIAIHEVLVYRIARATGGKGDFGRQFYLSSLVALSMAFLSVLYLFMPLPCINFLALAGLVVGGLYLSLYVNSKIYAKVHGIGYMHALAINIAVSVLRIAAIYFLMSGILSLLGLPTTAGF